MDTKLTLKINKSTIDSAKRYAREQETSLSKMIENYLQALTNKQVKDGLNFPTGKKYFRCYKTA